MYNEKNKMSISHEKKNKTCTSSVQRNPNLPNILQKKS